MKRVSAFLLAALVVLTLAGCRDQRVDNTFLSLEDLARAANKNGDSPLLFPQVPAGYQAPPYQRISGFWYRTRGTWEYIIEFTHYPPVITESAKPRKFTISPEFYNALREDDTALESFQVVTFEPVHSDGLDDVYNRTMVFYNNCASNCARTQTLQKDGETITVFSDHLSLDIEEISDDEGTVWVAHTETRAWAYLMYKDVIYDIQLCVVGHRDRDLDDLQQLGDEVLDRFVKQLIGLE